MSLIYKIEPREEYLIGNPIVIALSTISQTAINCEVKIAGSVIYESIYLPVGTDLYDAFISLADVIEPYFLESEISDPDQIVSELLNFKLPVEVTFTQEESTLTHSFDVYKGGITKKSFRLLDENGYDIFTFRLKNYFSQFLFTTRTNKKGICIRETELAPFAFIHPGSTIDFISDTGTTISSAAKAAGTVCVMDIAKIFSQMPEDTKRINVAPGGEYAFHFNIYPGQLSDEKYMIRFKNSMGYFELIEVVGKAMYDPEFLEESSYNTITEYDFYEERRKRTETRNYIDVETGYKNRDELPFILDMIKSDEIYFIHPDGISFRCYVTTDQAQFRNRMVEPTSFNLRIREVADEELSTPEITMEELMADAGIFDETFSEEFN